MYSPTHGISEDHGHNSYAENLAKPLLLEWNIPCVHENIGINSYNADDRILHAPRAPYSFLEKKREGQDIEGHQ